MSDNLRDLLRDEAQPIEVPPPPFDAILTGGRRRRTVRRAQVLVAVTAAVAAVVVGTVGVGRLFTDDARRSTPQIATRAPSPSPSASASPTLAAGTLEVSGTGVGTLPFGADAGQVEGALDARFGAPDRVLVPTAYVRIPGQDGFYETAGDPISPSWQYRAASLSCWGTLCLHFGGDDVDSLKLRGWVLAPSDAGTGTTGSASDIRLAGTGIGLGDTWEQLHAAYPGTQVNGGEGASVTVRRTPWAGVSDGVGAWRLSGAWDYQHPHRAPADAVVTRLSGGEGPEPGCC